MERKSTLILGSVLIGGVFLTNAVQFLIWHSSFASTKSAYTKQISALQNTLKEIGPLTDVYTVKASTDGGQAISLSNLTPIKMPQSIVQGQYILDPSTVVGKYLKILTNPGTPLLKDLLMTDPINSTSREVDIVYSMSTIGLKVGDYVDYRITFPTGEDYIVLSHKRVYGVNGRSIKLVMDETELQLYNSAVVDWYLHSSQGAVTYTTKYTDPGIQDPAKVFYAVPANILAVIQADPNIIDKASTSLASGRSIINSAIKSISDEAGGKLSTGRTSEENSLSTGSNAYEQAQKDAVAKASQTPTTPTTATPAPQTQPQPQTQPSTSTSQSNSSTAQNSSTAPNQSSKLFVGKGVQ